MSCCAGTKYISSDYHPTGRGPLLLRLTTTRGLPPARRLLYKVGREALLSLRTKRWTRYSDSRQHQRHGGERVSALVGVRKGLRSTRKHSHNASTHIKDLWTRKSFGASTEEHSLPVIFSDSVIRKGSLNGRGDSCEARLLLHIVSLE